MEYSQIKVQIQSQHSNSQIIKDISTFQQGMIPIYGQYPERIYRLTLRGLQDWNSFLTHESGQLEKKTFDLNIQLGQEKQQKVIFNTLEYILLEKREPTLSFKDRKINNDTQKRVIFFQNKKIDNGIPLQKLNQKQKQSGIVNSPLFKQNLLQTIPITESQNAQGSQTFTLICQEIQKEINVLKNNLQKIEDYGQLKNFVNEIQLENNEAKIQKLKQIILVKENTIKILEDQDRNKSSGNCIKLNDQNRLINQIGNFLIYKTIWSI